MVNMQRVRRIRMLIYGFLLFVFLAPLIITLTIFFQMLRLEAAFQEQPALSQAEENTGTAQTSTPLPTTSSPAEASSSAASTPANALPLSPEVPPGQVQDVFSPASPSEDTADESGHTAAEEPTAPGSTPLSGTQPPVAQPDTTGEPASSVPSSHPYTGG